MALKVKYEAWEKITYTTKDGTVKVKKDFVSKEVPSRSNQIVISKVAPRSSRAFT